jgi:outer membrane biosynthesis protein TonB
VKLFRCAALAAALALAACQSEPDASGITREQFIRANVAVRAVSDTTPDADTLRARALREMRVTPAQLKAWLAAHRRDTELLAETWTEIARRGDAADSTRHAASGGPKLPPGVRRPAAPQSPPPTPAAPPPAPPVQPTPEPPPVSKPAPPADSASATTPVEQKRERARRSFPGRALRVRADSAAARDSAGS